jgi:hypothetical protein
MKKKLKDAIAYIALILGVSALAVGLGYELAEADDNTITFPMCVAVNCVQVPAYTIIIETGEPLVIEWSPPTGQCTDCNIEWELITFEFQGVVQSGTTPTNNLQATFSIDKVGRFDVRYRQCNDVSTTPSCGIWYLSSDRAKEIHGFIIVTKLAAPGGGGI